MEKIQQKGYKFIHEGDECILYTGTIFVPFPPIFSICSSASLCLLVSQTHPFLIIQ